MTTALAFLKIAVLNISRGWLRDELTVPIVTISLEMILWRESRQKTTKASFVFDRVYGRKVIYKSAIRTILKCKIT